MCKKAEDISDMVDKTTIEFKSMDNINGGVIHIGCAGFGGMKYFVQTASELQKRILRTPMTAL